MPDLNHLEQSVQALITELCDTLERHGYETVSLGAMMRLLGVDEHRARDYDRDWITLNNQQRDIISRPPDRNLH
jgi:hypothetical protein